jgi:cupin fold WbuC family metalloprotein
MEKIFSKVEEGLLLHMIIRGNELSCGEGRFDLIPPENFLQCSSLVLNAGKTFKPHKHVVHAGAREVKAQESWVVLKGKVKCIFYDIDDQIIAQPILNSCDVSFSLHGGHNYVILEDNTVILEYKTGPYLGQALDKQFIN